VSKFIWKNGQRIPKNAAEEESTKRVILELDIELYNELEAYCIDRGITIEECIVDWIENGLPDEPDASTGDADRKKEQQKQTSDGRDPGRLSEHDEDNFSSTKNREKTKALVPRTPAERMEITAQIQNLFCAGRDGEARALMKIASAYDRHEQKANEPGVEQQRKSLVDSIVRSGNRLLGK
jgi:hypothetical protein